MGKTNKKFNWKARQVPDTIIDNAETSKIKIDTEVVGKEKYDNSNPLVLPSQKRKTQLKKQPGTVTKILSRKQRKRLEKIVDKKKKKENRSQLLQTLSEVQAKPDVMKELTSIASLQTKGLKRMFQEESSDASNKKVKHFSETLDELPISSFNSITGSKKRKALLKAGLWRQEEGVKTDSDANIVGFEETSSDESSIEDENTNEQGEECTSSANDEHGENSIERDGKEKEKMKSVENALSADDKSELISSDCVDGKNIQANTIDQNQIISAKQENSPNFSSKSIDTRGGMAPIIKVVHSSPAIFIPVNRKPSIQEARLRLPVIAEEQSIMEAISENSVVIIAGETGSGKTTQVPQFLYEAGYARNDKIIGVTEPRRVAAISMSKRIAEEMNLSSKEVSYLIRFEGNVTDDTKIKFMTDGVLLKEIQTDFLLNKYSVIVLDEAHERSVYTDILIGLLSRIVPLRLKRGNPLKLIIMSATLRLEDFVDNSRLFRITPPVIKIETRQFPVTIHFNKRTNQDYCLEAFRKTCKIHSQLPDGGILVFLTGQREVNTLVRKLRTAFPMKKRNLKKIKNKKLEGKLGAVNDSAEEDDEDELNMEIAIQKARKHAKRKVGEKSLPDINLDEYAVMPNDDTEADLLGQDDIEHSDDDDLDDTEILQSSTSQPMWVLPLYSILPSHEQAKVFQPPPEGCRLCVVATNVAETSLTIPNVKYVVDTGKWKSRTYDKVTGISSFDVDWCSKASANQRAGRAGRTGPGHCYRLYSSAVFNDSFPLYTIPEIQRKPVDDLVLQMKAMSIHKVVNFPFPSSPDLMQLRIAEKRLRLLGALTSPSEKNEDDFSGKLTSLGKAISVFPVSPRFGKMLALSHQHDLLAFTVCLVAALSVQEVLLEVPVSNSESLKQSVSQQQWSQIRRKWAGIGNSKLLGDPMILLRAVGAAEYAATLGDLLKFCTSNGLRHKAVVEIRKLRVQLTNEVNLNVSKLNLSVDPNMAPPSDLQAKLLRQVMLSGLADQVARRVDPEELKEGEDKRKWKHAYQIPEMESPVFMHSSSVLRKDLPQWVVYQEIYETNKTYMRGVTAIEPEWLPMFAPALCNISDPMMEPPPRYDAETDRLLCHVSSTFGRSGWPLPVMELDFPSTLDRYKWFARFLLDGSVIPKLSQFTKSLLSTPGTMVKTWANLQPRTEVLLKSLVSKQLDSATKLHNIWKQEPNYLLDAFKMWLPESAHPKVVTMWPPV